jgi:pilus assembly protein CpaE
MAMKVLLIGSHDSQIEAVLLACGAHVTRGGADDVAALTSPAARPPDAIVFDLPDGALLPAALTAVKRHHPSTGIMAVLPRLDAALVLQAMRAGVTECLAEPLTCGDVEAALQRIAARQAPPRAGDVFAIVGAKGGVGATTVAVNVATMLSRLRPASTLLIDLHLTYGDAGIFLGAEPRFSIVDALENMHRMDATFLHSVVTETKSGVRLLASSERQARGPIEMAHLSALIGLAATEFPYVVLDVPRSDPAALESLERAGTIVVVANQELATVRSASRMAAAMQERYGQDRVSVVITRYDEHAEIAQRDVERVVGRRVSSVLPNDYPVALASQNRGRPLVLDNHTDLASALTRFTRALANMPAEPGERASGLLSRIGVRSLNGRSRGNQ